jgi:hypothetical protein
VQDEGVVTIAGPMPSVAVGSVLSLQGIPEEEEPSRIIGFTFRLSVGIL